MSLKEVVPSSSDAAALARRTSPRSTVPGLARDAIDDLVGLFSSQLELTRAELRHDARAALKSGLRLLYFLPVLVIGYCLLVAAAVYGLAGVFGVWPTLVGMGALHVAVAVLGLWRASRGLAAVHFLDRSGAELGKSVDRVSEAITSPRLPSVP